MGILEIGRDDHSQRKEFHMNTIGINAPRRLLVMGAACLGLAAATITAPSAWAADDCSAEALSGTVSSVTGSAYQYLDAHPGANQAVTAAQNQSPSEASANLRGYFTAHPGEYVELRGILTPIGDKQRQCNVQLLSPPLSAAYNQFMAG
jgi:hemophore-related protein